MRFAVASFCLLASYLCLKVADAVEVPPVDVARFKLRDTASDAEVAFSEACKDGRVQDVRALLPKVRPAIATAEYIDAFLANRPDVVHALLKYGNVDANGGGQIFYHESGRSIGEELGNYQFSNIFYIYKSDDPRKPNEIPTFENRAVDRTAQLTGKQWRELARTKNIPLVFSYSGALAVACKLRNPSMASALFASPLFEDNYVNWCYNHAYIFSPHTYYEMVYRAAGKGSWKTLRDDRKEDMFEMLLATDRGNIEKLLTRSIDARITAHFERLLEHPRTTREMRAVALAVLLEKAQDYSSEYDVNHADEHYAHLAESIFKVDLGLLDDERFRRDIISKAAACRDRKLFAQIFKHAGWYMLSDAERTKVLSEAAGNQVDEKMKYFDERWFAYVVFHLRVPAKEIVAALEIEMAKSSRLDFEKECMNNMIVKLEAPCSSKQASKMGCSMWDRFLKVKNPKIKDFFAAIGLVEGDDASVDDSPDGDPSKNVNGSKRKLLRGKQKKE